VSLKPYGLLEPGLREARIGPTRATQRPQLSTIKCLDRKNSKAIRPQNGDSTQNWRSVNYMQPILLPRSVFYTILLPGTVTLLIPHWLVSSEFDWGSSSYPSIRYLGLLPIALGTAGLVWCIWRFYSDGRGTLAPIDPPKYLVVRGLYRYVRNPMYVGVLLILLGEAIAFSSRALLIEAGVFFVLAHLFVMFYEEPALRRQFGGSYERYLQVVGRWIPRRSDRTS
jgi:protein-S-isoprenylcysteine O-methyltransferase Ste14